MDEQKKLEELEIEEEVKDIKRKGKKPEKKYNIGTTTLSVFKHEKGSNEWNSYVLQRAYKDDDGNWKYSNSLNKRDLGNAIVLLQKALDEEIKEYD